MSIILKKIRHVYAVQNVCLKKWRRNKSTAAAQKKRSPDVNPEDPEKK